MPARKQPEDVPVYLFTGFLEGGKTKFIQETMEDPRFNKGERTLLLLCELYQSDAFTGNLLHIPADKSFPITADERHVIEMYRRHPELQSAVKRVLDVPVKKPSAN